MSICTAGEWQSMIKTEYNFLEIVFEPYLIQYTFTKKSMTVVYKYVEISTERAIVKPVKKEWYFFS